MKIHIVKEGDTLYALSQHYGVPMEHILQANPLITNPDELKVGLKVKIPTKPTKVIFTPGLTDLFKQEKVPAVPVEKKIDSFYDLPDLAEMDGSKDGKTPHFPGLDLSPGGAYDAGGGHGVGVGHGVGHGIGAGHGAGHGHSPGGIIYPPADYQNIYHPQQPLHHSPLPPYGAAPQFPSLEWQYPHHHDHNDDDYDNDYDNDFNDDFDDHDRDADHVADLLNKRKDKTAQQKAAAKLPVKKKVKAAKITHTAKSTTLAKSSSSATNNSSKARPKKSIPLIKL